MKKFICISFMVLVFAFCLCGCQIFSVFNGEEKSDEDIYYADGNQVYYKTDNGTELVCAEEEDIRKLVVVDEAAYYSVSDEYGYNFAIKYIPSGSNAPKTLIAMDDQMNDWVIYDKYIFFSVNMILYRYSITDSTTELIDLCVNAFDCYNGYVYFIDHASRTFTIYRLPIDATENDKQEVFLGNNIYNREDPKELISNFVITKNGDIVYTQRVPYGLYIYSDGKTELIVASDRIDENRLIHDDGNIYYVIKDDGFGTLYCYTDKKECKQIAQLQDYSKLVSVKNGRYSYKNTSGELITQ